MHHHRDKECEGSGENDNPLLSSGMGERIMGLTGNFESGLWFFVYLTFFLEQHHYLLWKTYHKQC